METSLGMDNIYLAIAVAAIIVLITFLITKKLRKPLNIVLLMGLSDAGKTAIFSRLVFNKPKKTVASLKENEASISDLNIKLIDLPGAERLRIRLWDQYRSGVQHILYVVDSSEFQANLRNTSEYLYKILADEIIHRRKVNFTILCHKQDVEGAARKDEISSKLEKELNAIKDTYEGQLNKTSEEEDVDYLVSKFGKQPISFESIPVRFIETSVNNLEELIKIIF